MAYMVWARALRAAFDVAALHHVSLTDACSGLPFDAASLRTLRYVRWEDYCVACERLEAACGGPETCQRLLEESYHEVLSEFRGFASGVLSPLSFARLTLGWLSPLVYQGCTFDLEERGPNELRVTLQLRAGARPSLTFFRATVGELRALPRHLGLEAAHVRASYDAEHGVYDMLLPASRSVVDRALSLVEQGAQLVLSADLLGVPLTLDLQPSSGDLATRLEVARHRWSLTMRQLNVLSSLVEGDSNKEIAQRLECAENTVELHVTGLLRRAGVNSRSRLLAHFWSRL
jgi:DNA-binding CsgD family transcriptional regulator